MDKIKHGRRKGGERLSPTIPSIQAHSAPNLRHITVIGKGDWDRISNQLNKHVIQAEKQKKIREEKERLRNMSKEKVKNWSNTIAGQRQKKLEARAIREAKDEEERKAVDVEEAQYQSVKRKEAIERAKTQQYYQTDHVKGFHGALLLSEVLKERDAQLELKKLKEIALDGQDEQWLQLAQQQHEEAILEDQRNALEKMKNARDNADFMKQQIKSHMKSAAEEQHLEQVEGDELKRLAAHYELEKRRLDEARALETKQMMAENLQQIDDVKRMKQINLQQEEEEDEECRVFAAAKRKMMKLRAEKESALHKEKQESLEKIREKLYAQMQQRKDDEDIRIDNAKTETEEKIAEEERQKMEKNHKWQKDMAVHRNQQMADQENQMREKRKQELEMLRVQRQADEQFHENEARKNQLKFDINKDFQKFHQSQIDERVGNAQARRTEQLQQDKKNDEFVNLEEMQFQEYANQVIDHARNRGRNVYPLEKAAREGAGGGLGPIFPGKGGVRPSYMTADRTGVQLPNYQRSTTDDTKRSIYGSGSGHTNKRLGFVW